MADGAVSIAMITFLLSTLLLSSIPEVAICTSPSPLIKDVCGSTAKEVKLDPKICAETLVSEPRVVAASNLVSMSIALIEAGISNATKTRSYVQKMLKRRGLKPDYKYVLQQCDSGYEHFGWSFASALGEVKEGEYDTATYDIKVGYTDNIDECRNALSSKNVKDGAISRGNAFLFLIGEVGFNTVDRLPSH
ncbi:uncharacterized protein LOC142523997 [Primulina tabacum]|uniref:uncharacterized protein LOC142523997 n=1 Tax=Primulina tabacum TaxID=48773 RepID=UPI003F5A9DB4